MDSETRYKKAKLVTVLGGVVNTTLGFLKFFGGIFYNSHALIADGIHSFSDLLTDIMVLFASKYGSQDADHSHPYGHQRIETAATFILSLLLILAGSGIIWDSADEFLKHTTIKPGIPSLYIALFSIVVNEVLFHYTSKIGKQIRSDLVIANAWHHRSDAASSIVVFLGLAGAIAGFHYLDAIAAIIVGLMVIKMGWDYGWNSVKQLVDSAVSAEILESINHNIMAVDGVHKVHQLRSRMMGSDIFIDVHILVDPYITVSEGHFIAQRVHRTLLHKVDGVKDVTVHVDPEDDEITSPSFHLATRTELENNFIKEWQQHVPQIKHWIVHYLDGKIILDIILKDPIKEEEKMYLSERLRKQNQITQVRLFHKLEDLTITLAK